MNSRNIRIILLCTVAILAAFLLLQEKFVSDPVKTGKKINGVSLVASPHPIQKEELVPVTKLNAGWVAITPYAFAKSGKPAVTFNHNQQWWGERKEGVAQTIIYAKALGLHVMLKPHVWLHGDGDSWTGNFSLESESQWKQWEHDYGAYIITFAHLADSLNGEMICIGTEYDAAARQRPEFWRKLIKHIRSFYDGKLTYAANWDQYQTIPFWDALDYIGVDAYFPLSKEKKPSKDILKSKWSSINNDLQQFSNRNARPILFTEFGYRSVNYTTDGHWNYQRGEREINLQTQVDAYEALLETFWDEPWFAGGFLWKWYTGEMHFHRDDRSGYSPQGKPAEDVLRNWYKKN